jgi:hypothetical protein
VRRTGLVTQLGAILVYERDGAFADCMRLGG